MSEGDLKSDLKSKLASSITSILFDVGAILWGVDYGFYGNGKFGTSCLLNRIYFLDSRDNRS